MDQRESGSESPIEHPLQLIMRATTKEKLANSKEELILYLHHHPVFMKAQVVAHMSLMLKHCKGCRSEGIWQAHGTFP